MARDINGTNVSRDPRPRIDIAEEVTAIGRLERQGESVEVDSAVFARDRYDDNSPWTFTAWSSKEGFLGLMKLMKPGREPFRFSGVTVRGESIVAEPMMIRQIKGSVLVGAPDIVAVGNLKLGNKIARQSIEIEITPTPLALPLQQTLVQHWNGELKALKRGLGRKSPPPSVRLMRRTYRLEQHFDWDEAQVGKGSATVRIPRTVLVSNLSRIAAAGDLEAFAKSLFASIEDLLDVLSFLSRRHIRWHRVRIFSEVESERSGSIESAEWVRGLRTPNREFESKCLLQPRGLPKDWMRLTLARYSAIERKRGVRAAILHLSIARGSQFVDVALSNAYVAFEAMASSLIAHANNRIVPSEEFAAFKTELRKTAATLPPFRDWTPRQVDRLFGQIEAANRRSLAERALEEMSTRRIQLDDLWPEGVLVEDGLRAIFSRRGKFIHTGVYGDPIQLRADFDRLTAMTERLLLHELQVPVAWQDSSIDGERAYLRSMKENKQRQSER